MSGKGTVLSGMRPTGPLHLGHYFGALENWLRLQNEGYACYFMTADWHALTTGYEAGLNVAQFRREIVAEWLAIGLDPAKCTIFAQAQVLEHAELATLLGMVTPIPWLERVPSYKEMQSELADRDLNTIGFLGYPVLQTADIALYKGTQVPVGEDQLPHVELSRMVVRRFNHLYGEVFPEPQGLVTKVRRLPGLDGRKMSKSFNNAIYLGDTPEEVKAKVMPAPTDPARVKRSDPGTPEKCNIYTYHGLVSSEADIQWSAEGCRTASIGCVDCKKKLIGNLEAFLDPIRARRTKWLSGGEVDEVLSRGNARAREVAGQTMAQVRKAMAL